MQREIKFRGKPYSEEYKGWLYGSLIVYNDGSTAIYNDKTGMTIPVRSETVGQYTGLRDKNRTEIYEGDIVKRDKSWAVVEFRHTEFLAMDRSEQMNCNLLGWGDEEIIGNIHDNPELLKP